MKKIIAHRGFCLDCPENSILAFRKGLDNDNFNGLETDIRISRDGILFCFHDDYITRTTDGDIETHVEEMIWNDIKQLYLKDRDGNVTTCQIPSLESLLMLNSSHHKLLNLEIKSNTKHYSKEELVRHMNVLINKYEMYDYVILSAFDNYYYQICNNYGLLFGLLILATKVPTDDILPEMLILDKTIKEDKVKEFYDLHYVLGVFTLNNFNNTEDPSYLQYFDYLIKDKL